MIKVTDDNFEDTVLDSKRSFLVEFSADRCHYCNVMKNVIDEVAEERKDVDFGVVDVDVEGLLTDIYSIRSIPTMILFKKGEVVARKSGVISKDELEAMIGGIS